ncbi:Hypothetical protein EAG7_02777 [Klebsiella aerogenes]|jgi:hypothetical protein|nr:Hypothetical protein EAG7_02777 [Klebsiella aerogenes]PVF74713.1 hypothetical protein CSC18_3778 [Klebsiella aerogenes]CCG31254.1 hypothetical protein [Klebsiella aerogenes EA1509E]
MSGKNLTTITLKCDFFSRMIEVTTIMAAAKRLKKGDK